MRWQFQEAKQRLSALVRQAIEDGPQIVTLRGEDAVVVVSCADYRRLKAVTPNFKDFLMCLPDLDTLEIYRSEDLARAVEL
jgi:prevent-host-death family protein